MKSSCGWMKAGLISTNVLFKRIHQLLFNEKYIIFFLSRLFPNLIIKVTPIVKVVIQITIKKKQSFLDHYMKHIFSSLKTSIWKIYYFLSFKTIFTSNHKVGPCSTVTLSSIIQRHTFQYHYMKNRDLAIKDNKYGWQKESTDKYKTKQKAVVGWM